MKRKTIMLILFSIVVIIGIALTGIILNNKKIYITYIDFDNMLKNNEIEMVILEDNSIEFYKNEDKTRYYTDNPETDGFKEKILLQGIKVEENSIESMIAIILDLIIFGMFGFALILGGGKLVQINIKTFKVIRHTEVNFSHIAGMEELKREMLKTVDVLKNQKEYAKKGIRPIKGIIFEGPPGNGKTLFAKALAEEAGVNFIATKGADFQSAMMSMGARKIKTLFKKARRHKPCIIFIDEFDGIGERRNYAGTGVDKENNRIITAMLNEMDGFDSQDGILVIAATNSYASLDPALIRPGRFDIKYNISNPDALTRLKLIDLYTKNKMLEDNIEKRKLVDGFENLSCSAIETILNEASMLAIINNREKIGIEDIILAGKKTNCNINLKKLR